MTAPLLNKYINRYKYVDLHLSTGKTEVDHNFNPVSSKIKLYQTYYDMDD